jgi:Zn finger protein HypA/HybF involved in hydrogenase expression
MRMDLRYRIVAKGPINTWEVTAECETCGHKTITTHYGKVPWFKWCPQCEPIARRAVSDAESLRRDAT